jgi:hypothetical protein
MRTLRTTLGIMGTEGREMWERGEPYLDCAGKKKMKRGNMEGK